jgi:hypothetical protein
MMKKVLILLAVLFLIGCKGQGADEGSADSSFIGGTDGISVAFVEGDPPVEVLDAGQEQFLIRLLLQNNGEYAIPVNGIIATLSGVSKEAFNIKSMSVKSDFELDRARKSRTDRIAGAVEELSFGEAKYEPDLPADFFTELRADVCYDYETTGLVKVCLRKELLKRDESPNCNVDTSSPVENSGGPIQVASFEQRPSSADKLKITFEIMNQGNGKVYKPGTFKDSCGSNEPVEDVLEVEMTSPTNNFDVKCSKFSGTNKGEVKLLQGDRITLSCDVLTDNIEADNAFNDLLLIKIKYMYRQAVNVPITIRDAEF